MLIAVLIIGCSCMMNSCKESEDNLVRPSDGPGPLVTQLKGFWYDVKDVKGVFKGNDESYDKVLLAYKFYEDGTGAWDQLFFTDEGRVVGTYGGLLEVPSEKDNNPTGLFKYVSSADGTVTIFSQVPQVYDLPEKWQVKFQDDGILVTVKEGDFQLQPGSEQVEEIVRNYDDESLSGGEGDGNKNSLELDADVKDVKYTILRDTAMWKFNILSKVLPSIMHDTDIEKELERLKNESQTPVKLGTRSLSDPMTTLVPSGFRYIDYTYESVDEQGKPITLSSRVCWGVYMGFRSHYFEFRPNHLVLCAHSTIADNPEAPSQGGSLENLALQGDRVLILPDYIGYGVTKDRVHPYVNHDLCARNCIDALKAGYKIFAEKSNKPLHPDWRFYVIGASQGAGNALAIHKWLDTHEDFANRWRFEYSYCAAGPYSPRITFEEYFKQRVLDYPIVLPLTIKAMFAAFPDILGKWKEDDFYSEAYLKNKENIDLMISSKKFFSGDINKAIFNMFPHTGENGIQSGKQVLMTDLLAPDVCDMESEKCKAFFECFDRCDLTKGWTPKHPIHLYHGKNDTYVSFANSEAVVAAFPGMTTLKTTMPGSDGHLAVCFLWMMSVAFGFW